MAQPRLTRDQPLILFDGECNLCNGSVQFVLKRERCPYYWFASLQSRFGQEILQHYGLPRQGFDSFVLVERGRIYTRSSAALRVTRRLRGLWPLLSLFLFVPRVVRDFTYDVIGARRYRWFGRTQICWANTAEWRSRFVDT